ncbi:MAG: hypothetical protein JWO09_1743 [Bacteroidetes bacterium]|nr:hypothetical protein [Bacteroidota bacterium]
MLPAKRPGDLPEKSGRIIPRNLKNEMKRPVYAGLFTESQWCFIHGGVFTGEDFG